MPPNPRQWGNEHNALDLREQLKLGLDVPLPHEAAFELLGDVQLFGHSSLPAASVYIEHLRGNRSWSGLSVPCPDGGAIVVFNDSHPPARIRATLMEEFFHLRLGHPPSTIRIYRDGAERTFNKVVENEAYGSGAAALVPYQSLRAMIGEGRCCREIADLFRVSEQLVTFRAKVTKQYSKLRL